MKKYICIAVAILFIYNHAKSQESSSPDVLIMGVPQYLFVNGLRIDVDLKTKKTNNWLVLSPIIYLSQNADNFFDNEDILGGGLEITSKHFLSKNQRPKGLYFAYSGLYTYNTIKKDGYYWDEQGVYMHEVIGENTTYIHKLGANCFVGSQFELTENLFTDFYIGFGFRYSILNYDKGEGSYYNSSWFDHGYSGFLLVSGFRLGVGL